MSRDWADAVAAVAITVWRWAASGLGVVLDAVDWLRDVAPARLRDLLGDTSRSDGDAAPTPYQAAATALGHEAIGLWTYFVWVGLGFPWGVAALLSAAQWFGWETWQYIKSKTVRTLRDMLLGDNPSYAIGISCGVLITLYPWAALPLTPLVVIWPGINGLVFGRIK